eukprot:TRINITY_DN21844_c0_g1_i1.p1 TRINITY_DN21844_c0_g1~~TRINITY_DN21844_c0_g1_i1.p1  ORF type:complete len:298 (-),score=40.05 TRINITY_DN21844_c0_g1_i1:38-931(-)
MDRKRRFLRDYLQITDIPNEGGLMSLFDDLLKAIMMLLTVDELVAISSVCRRFQMLCGQLHRFGTEFVQNRKFRLTNRALNNFQGLKRLRLSHQPILTRWITDIGIEGMQLTDLDLESNHGVTDEGIRGMPLKRLNISNNSFISDHGIKGIAITDLTLSDVSLITDDGIKGMPLTKLKLSTNHHITNNGIRDLPLVDLNLDGNCNITNDGIRHLPLTSLSLIRNDLITDEGIQHLPITNLSLGNSSITEKSLRCLPLIQVTLPVAPLSWRQTPSPIDHDVLQACGFVETSPGTWHKK